MPRGTVEAPRAKVLGLESSPERAVPSLPLAKTEEKEPAKDGQRETKRQTLSSVHCHDDGRRALL